ncbi:hypothetical protein SPRG_15634 [Saprolegnia parasitica CBS 223.65]|uniref:Major facilitator superfamily (MFS) profile domain-containing protein n=1 Tax=Saprolegnia parasitica (strain CBS 223.65) TaxID=695850 RepID=A0A067BY24_SAPPC|nr:hypothetical protein SPRG_15634 [Saprolegnia parasitica CBS 223.65]KDO19191.1 hypothetical protein SPRG_15634 [Saprolegnia parasitica CBS 223.65]|eukprot:XP_012210091.1 hypothetical protein SPRG_15634 [Saprolegnia parasitica CBS 223.65]
MPYWTIELSPKPLYEVQAERFLFFWPLTSNELQLPKRAYIRFHRVYLFIAIFLVQLCSGLLYAFLSLPNPINIYFQFPGDDSAAAWLILAAGCVGIVQQSTLGPLLERQGPRWGMTRATLFMALCLACMLLSVHIPSWPLFCAAMLGAALSFSAFLVVSVSTAMKWCPDARGTVAGVCLVGFGVGKGIWTLLYCAKTGQDGIDMKRVVALFLLTLLPTMAVATLVIRTPPSDFSVAGFDMHCIPSVKAPDADLVQDEFLRIGMTLVNYEAIARHSNSLVEGTDRRYHEQVKALSLLQCILSLDFICLLFAQLSTCMTGILYDNLTGATTSGTLLQTMYHLSDDDTTTLHIHGLVIDLLGRLVPAILSDVGIRVFYANPAAVRKVFFTSILMLQCIAIPVAYLESDKLTHFAHVEWLLYVLQFASNADASLLVCHLTDLFGVYHIGTMYGLSSMTWALGQALVFATTGNDTTALAYQMRLLGWLSLGGLFSMLFVRADSADRFYRGYRFTVCGKIVVERPWKEPPQRQGTFDICVDVRAIRSSAPYLCALDSPDDDDEWFDDDSLECASNGDAASNVA